MANILDGRRRFRREKRYTRSITLSLSDRLGLAVVGEAELRDCSMSAVIRECIERGLPLVRDARRKQQQRSRSRGGGS